MKVVWSDRALKTLAAIHERTSGRRSNNGLAAMDAGDGTLAVWLCNAAASSDPNDAGLVANLALAHMLNGNDALALECAERALRMNPRDDVSLTVRDFVREVSSAGYVSATSVKSLMVNGSTIKTVEPVTGAIQTDGHTTKHRITLNRLL
jgi:hypothetical protein